MDDVLQQQIDAAIRSYDIELQWWETPPDDCHASRYRLTRFIEWECPDFLIENEINILRKKVMRMVRLRLFAALDRH